jgi:hypothetical protein
MKLVQKLKVFHDWSQIPEPAGVLEFNISTITRPRIKSSQFWWFLLLKLEWCAPRKALLIQDFSWFRKNNLD